MVRNFRIDFNLVDNRTLEQILERPSQVRQIDAIHGGTHAHHWRQKVNLLLGMLRLQAIDQVKVRCLSPI